MPVVSSLSFVQAVKLSIAVLIAIEISFVAINLAHYALGFPSKMIHIWFYLDSERSVPTWFSASQLFAVGIVFLVVANLTLLSTWPKLMFLICGLGFIFLSMDEAISFHETVGRTLEPVETVPNPFGGHSQFVWAYPLFAVVLILLNLRAVRECWTMERHASFYCGLGVMLFIFGGAGIELIGHAFPEKDPKNFGYLLQVCGEEFFEMLGCTVILYGALLFLQSALAANGRAAATA